MNGKSALLSQRIMPSRGLIRASSVRVLREVSVSPRFPHVGLSYVFSAAPHTFRSQSATGHDPIAPVPGPDSNPRASPRRGAQLYPTKRCRALAPAQCSRASRTSPSRAQRPCTPVPASPSANAAAPEQKGSAGGYETVGRHAMLPRQALQMVAFTSCAICAWIFCHARGLCGQNAPGSPRIRPGDRVCDMLLLPQWAARSATSLARVQRSVFLYPHTVIYCLSVPNPLHLGINISACLHISALVQFASICANNSAK